MNDSLFDTVSRSAERLARAQAFADRLDIHAAEIRGKLDASAGDETAGPLRGELVEVDRRRRLAAAALADVKAEHDRRAADLRAERGTDGEARAVLRSRHAERAEAQVEVDRTAAIASRAKAHAEAVEGRLADARAAEARYDGEAAARLHAALRDGEELPTSAEAFVRTSPGLEDDARAARGTASRASAEHAEKVRALAEVDRKVRGAVDGILFAEAEVIAREVLALDERTKALRCRLDTYATRRRGDYVEPPAPVLQPGQHSWELRPVAPAPFVIGSALIGQARRQPDPWGGATTADTSLAADRAWQSYATALVTNAAAELNFAGASAAPGLLPSVQAMIAEGLARKAELEAEAAKRARQAELEGAVAH